MSAKVFGDTIRSIGTSSAGKVLRAGCQCIMILDDAKVSMGRGGILFHCTPTR